MTVRGASLLPSHDLSEIKADEIQKNSKPVGTTSQPVFVFGLDEVGRGCLAGPALLLTDVIQTHQKTHKLRIHDSKKLNEPQRDAANDWLLSQSLVTVATGQCSPAEIGELNILHASGLAMRRAFDAVFAKVCEREGTREITGVILIDGNYVPRDFLGFRSAPGMNVITLTKGDGRSFAIAGAALVAKVYRDRLMAEIALSEPGLDRYGWESNVGYPTSDHRDAIAKFGPTKWHRPGFRLLPDSP